jgi:hypothetical protein
MATMCNKQQAIPLFLYYLLNTRRRTGTLVSKECFTVSDPICLRKNTRPGACMWRVDFYSAIYRTSSFYRLRTVPQAITRPKVNITSVTTILKSVKLKLYGPLIFLCRRRLRRKLIFSFFGSYKKMCCVTHSDDKMMGVHRRSFLVLVHHDEEVLGTLRQTLEQPFSIFLPWRNP